MKSWFGNCISRLESCGRFVLQSHTAFRCKYRNNTFMSALEKRNILDYYEQEREQS